jgi:hypothetical protein
MVSRPYSKLIEILRYTLEQVERMFVSSGTIPDSLNSSDLSN